MMFFSLRKKFKLLFYDRCHALNVLVPDMTSPKKPDNFPFIR